MIHPRIVCFPFHMGQSRAKIQLAISSYSPSKFRQENQRLTTTLIYNRFTQRISLYIGIKSFSFFCWTHSALWDRKWAPSLEWQSYLLFFTQILVLFGSKFKYSHKRRQDEEGKQSSKAGIRQLVLTFCPTICCCLQRKRKLLMPVFGET